MLPTGSRVKQLTSPVLEEEEQPVERTLNQSCLHWLRDLSVDNARSTLRLMKEDRRAVSYRIRQKEKDYRGEEEAELEEVDTQVGVQSVGNLRGDSE